MKHSPRLFLLASVPAALIGLWNLGANLQDFEIDSTGSWRLELLQFAGRTDESTWLGALIGGCVYFAPLLLTSLAVSRIWAEVFSRARRRPLEQAWMLTAWVYALMIPATVPLHLAAIGLSFGVIFGSHVFGGTGRYIANPALLGLVFMTLAYPVAQTQWLPGSDSATTWSVVAISGVEASIAAGWDWPALLLGREITAPGVSSALACLPGAAYLVFRGLASWRTIVAAIVAAALAAALIGEIPWTWHLVLGSFAFALAFIATDTTTRPATSGGCWLFGAAFGALTILIRMLNPEHPEGTVFALLLASLCIPLFDQTVAAVRGRIESGQQAHDGG